MQVCVLCQCYVVLLVIDEEERPKSRDEIRQVQVQVIGVVKGPSHSHFWSGHRDYHIYPRWLTPHELLVAQGIPVFGSAVPWARDPFLQNGDPDCRRIQQVSSFQRDVPRRARGQLCHLGG